MARVQDLKSFPDLLMYKSEDSQRLRVIDKVNRW